MATFLWLTVQNSPRARGQVWMAPPWNTCTRTNANLAIQSATAKGSRWFPGQHGDCSIAVHTESPACARGRVCIPHRRAHARDPMVTWKSNRPPPTVHFSFQDSMATFLLLTIQNSPRARALGHVCVARRRTHAPEPMPTGQSNRPPRRGHFSFQANVATSLLLTAQNFHAHACRSA